MHVSSVTLKNYRCFPNDRQARFTIGPGFTAFIGANNSGKSSLLKAFFEHRDLFNLIANQSNLVAGLQRSVNFNLHGVTDPDEVFCNRNELGMEIQLDLSPDAGDPSARLPTVRRVILSVARRRNQATAAIDIDGIGRIEQNSNVGIIGSSQLAIDNRPVADLAGVAEAVGSLAGTFYVGPTSWARLDRACRNSSWFLGTQLHPVRITSSSMNQN